MHQQDAVDRRIAEREIEFLHQCGERGARRRPFHHALRRRHEGKTAFRLIAKQAEIGRRVTDPGDPLRARIAPALANPAADEPSRNRSELLSVEVAKVYYVKRHGNADSPGTMYRPPL